jgi:hypothetical protein
MAKKCDYIHRERFKSDIRIDIERLSKGWKVKWKESIIDYR